MSCNKSGNSPSKTDLNPGQNKIEPEGLCAKSYKKITTACFTGRATGLPLPANETFSVSGELFTESWNQGAYTDEYKGPSFSPIGESFSSSKSIMPPYFWGAIGQLCDSSSDRRNYQGCLSQIEKEISNPTKNARNFEGKFYWKKHGHNCHDAAEDVGTCLLNSIPYLESPCELQTKVIVWDTEPDINKAVGNIYHSQLLVKRIVENPTTKQIEPIVCLEEPQMAISWGTSYDECCTRNTKIFEGGSIEEYVTEFKSCSNLWFRETDIKPHLYEVSRFREQRQSGIMDVESNYDRYSGAKALRSAAPFVPKGFFRFPQITGIAFDPNGRILMINVK